MIVGRQKDPGAIAGRDSVEGGSDMWVVALTVSIALGLLWWSCCYASGGAAQWEEDNLRVRKS